MSTDNVINEILEKADIVEVVSDYIKLDKKGSNYVGLCPFHNDNNPSFFVSPTKKLCRCMVCGTGGNAITILERLAKIGKKEAIRRIANRYNIKYDINLDKKVYNKKGLFQITSYAANFYNYYLNNSLPGKEALNYLHSRDISDEIIKNFKIGLAPTGKNTLYLSLKDQGYSDIDMAKAGVISSTEFIHDTFINRIMFPITDEENNIIGFSGRIFYESNEAKYFNSFENELFKKGEVIYNLFNALDAIRKNNRIIIVEGFMDVIASYKAGLKECVCLMGTAMTKEHVEKIKNLGVDVIICLDGDNAGKQATIKALDILQKYGVNAYAVLLPDNLDPDDYVKTYGKDQFKDIFEKELVDSYTFRYEYLKDAQSLDDVIGVQGFETNVFEMIRKTKNQVIVEKFLNKLAIDLSSNIDTINNDFKDYLKSKNTHIIDTKTKNNTVVSNGTLKAYEILIRYMMFSRNDLNRINNALDQIAASQAKYIPNFSPTQIISLIYKYYDLDPNDKYFDLYIEYISKIQVYFKSNEIMDIERFLSMLTANLKEFYDDKIKNIITTDDKKKQKEINDCYNKLTCFIIEYGIKRFNELIKENPADSGYFTDQIIQLKRELMMINKG